MRDRMSYALIGGVLLFAAGGMTLRGEYRTRLTSGEMDRARGGNQGLNLVPSRSCNTLNGNAVCAAAGVACTTCGTAFYKDVGANAGQYLAGAVGGGSCTDIYTSMCIANGNGFSCWIDPAGNTGKACKAPPAAPATQAPTGF